MCQAPCIYYARISILMTRIKFQYQANAFTNSVASVPLINDIDECPTIVAALYLASVRWHICQMDSSFSPVTFANSRRSHKETARERGRRLFPSTRVCPIDQRKHDGDSIRANRRSSVRQLTSPRIFEGPPPPAHPARPGLEFYRLANNSTRVET